jgi:DNA invertase Pin-like site-specific DNA recombinase
VVDIIQRIAQLESEQIGERTYMGMAQKAESGEGLLGFNPPYGYSIRENDLAIVDEEAQVVRSIFTHYLQGETMTEIAWKLNRDSSMTRRGNLWTKWSIGHLLHNPAYAGFRRWDGFLVPSKHEAIINVDEFNLTQRAIADRVRDPRLKKLIELPRT